MILSSLRLLPPKYPFIKQTRTIRTSIKIGKDIFQLTADVHRFHKEELRIKAVSEYLIIEGKHERKTDNGFVVRQFVRKFKLPSGCDPKQIKSQLSPEGILTITAERQVCDQNYPCETLIPINHGDSKDPDETFVLVNDVKAKPSVCDGMGKSKPKGTA